MLSFAKIEIIKRNFISKDTCNEYIWGLCDICDKKCDVSDTCEDCKQYSSEAIKYISNNRRLYSCSLQQCKFPFSTKSMKVKRTSGEIDDGWVFKSLAYIHYSPTRSGGDIITSFCVNKMSKWDGNQNIERSFMLNEVFEANGHKLQKWHLPAFLFRKS